MAEKVYLYDSTLRDGAQTRGVDFTTVDKQDIARELDAFGIDYIEAGWPGANPTDDAFFAEPPKMKHAALTAFGMTRRANTSAANDPGLSQVLGSSAGVVCLVGKAWDFHVKKALGTSLVENIKMITSSIEYAAKRGKEVILDAEHFFDGFKANPDYATEVVKAAYDAGSRWVVLCDTNGGTLPHEVSEIVKKITKTVPGKHLGIHCHNDTENAVANSLAAVQAGVRHVQGTINGVGERCGNANLVTIIPTLILKMGFTTSVNSQKLQKLTKLSRFLDDRLNKPSNEFAAYVGEAAFAHKGGLHASAVAKDSSSYEHIDPAAVGNNRNILVSRQSGRANILERLKIMGLNPDEYDKGLINALVAEVKEREHLGYAYDAAEASFFVLAHQVLEGEAMEFFRLKSFRVIDERRWNAKGKLVMISEATARVEIGGEVMMTVAEGNGPVNALDQSLRKALALYYNQLGNTKLVDYKVRILTPHEGTGATTRVLIESEDDKGRRWRTIGVSANIIDASYNALRDSINYKLMQSGAKPVKRS